VDNTLLGVGVGCIIAAIIGGGLKAFGMEIPLFNSIKRQALLGVFGLTLFTSSFILHNAEPTQRENVGSESVTEKDDCISGYTWRLAVPSDHVCVSEDSRKRVELENQRAAERRELSGQGNYGADTCLIGYVWREAFEGDTVCVLPSRREEVREENSLTTQRVSHTQ